MSSDEALLGKCLMTAFTGLSPYRMEDFSDLVGSAWLCRVPCFLL
jgi:hypothetical protein